MNENILIIEDDPLQSQMLEVLIKKKFSLHPISAHNGREGLNILAKSEDNSIALIIMDVNMPIMGGMETLPILRETYPDIPVIMLTGNKNVSEAVTAIKAGASDFISKPFETERMAITIQNALKLKLLKKEVSRLNREKTGNYDFNQLIGHNSGLRQCIALGRKLARSDIPALITGPTGSGKEIFSHAIHGESHRGSMPFIAVNCGAIPSQLVESTLFGHEKGAFTGAIEKTPGKFREAEGGTIFLDEVGELPLDTQVKLLRVLQQKEVEVVGSAKAIPINVRIISATNRNLENEVKKGRFREDLYFRLNVLEVNLPALKDRKTDIIALAHHFIERACARENRIPLTLPLETQQILLGHDWPGNVRELENVIHRALVLCEGNTLTPKDFDIHNEHSQPNIIQQSQILHHEHTINEQSPYQRSNGTFKTMKDIEQEAMEQALAHFNNNTTQAAKALGIAKSTFYRKQAQK